MHQTISLGSGLGPLGPKAIQTTQAGSQLVQQSEGLPYQVLIANSDSPIPPNHFLIAQFPDDVNPTIYAAHIQQFGSNSAANFGGLGISLYPNGVVPYQFYAYVGAWSQWDGKTYVLNQPIDWVFSPPWHYPVTSDDQLPFTFWVQNLGAGDAYISFQIFYI